MFEFVKNNVKRVLRKVPWFHKKTENMGYLDLAPRDDLSSCKNEHLKALEWAIENKKIQNIALAGPYGSGKSSIIRSFLKQHGELKCLQVSLASFLENEKKGENFKEGKLIDLDSSIQEAILMQLFYKVRQKKIPQSRFRKLHRIGVLAAYKTLLILGAFTTWILYVFKNEVFNGIVQSIKEAGEKIGLSIPVTLVITIAIFLVVLFYLAKIYRQLIGKIAIREVKIPTSKTTQAIVGEDTSKESVFNKYMDEILYFFEEMKYDVVFFEDLDRLNEPSIFVKLRELNTLINNYDAIKNPVKFVYAVKDDIFTDTDRTKFFEFIIPVIPVINSTNSSDELQKILSDNKAELKHEISREFVLDIAPFISDMRLLQNSFNEFLLYKKTLESGQALELKDECMFALAIFKNLYPDIFADLQAEKGLIKQAFDYKHCFVKNKTDELFALIDEKSKLIQDIANDALRTKKEIISSMHCAITGWVGIAHRIEIDDREYSVEKFLDDGYDLTELEHFRKIGTVRYTKISHYYSYPYYENYTPDKEQQEEYRDYIRRLKKISLAENHELELVRLQVEEQKTQVRILEEQSLKSLIDSFGVEQVLPEEIRENKVLVFMLRKGYIDEKYLYYINYFRGDSISTNDMNFILSIKNHEAKPYEFELSEIENVIDRLQTHEFEQKEVRNYDLLEILLFKEDKYQKQLKSILCQLSNWDEDSWDFIEGFYNRTRNKSLFICRMAETGNSFWNRIYQNPVLTEETRLDYFKQIMLHVESEVIKKLDIDFRVTDYFLTDRSILRKLSIVSVQKLKDVIRLLKIRFIDVSFREVDEELTDFIIQNQYYQLNSMMIKNIVECYRPELLDGIGIHNYSCVSELEDESPLLAYIHSCWEKYVSEIILEKNNTKESAKAVQEILERTYPNTDMCADIIRHEQDYTEILFKDCLFDQITKEDSRVKEVWDLLLEENRIVTNWNNIEIYWNQWGLTDQLSGYIEDNIETLILTDNSELDSDMKVDLLLSNEINDSVFNILVRSVINDSNTIYDYHVSDISESHLKIIIESELFTWHLDSFYSDFFFDLGKTYPELQYDFIVCNQRKYLNSISEVDVDQLLYEKLLESVSIERPVKEALVKKYATKYVTEHSIRNIILQSINVTRQIFELIWNHCSDDELRKKFFFDNLNVLDADGFQMCFTGLKEYEALSMRTKHDVTLADTEEHRRLFDRLKDIVYITSWKPLTVFGKQDDKKEDIIKCRVKAI